MKLPIVYLGLVTVFMRHACGAINRVIPNMYYQVEGCEGSDLVIECPVGYFMEISDGYFGRTSPSHCLPEDAAPVPEESLPCTNIHVSGIHSITECNNRESCTIKVDSAVFAPELAECPGGRYINISFNCIKPLNEVHVCEGETLKLSCPNEELIQVVDVLYGRNDQTRCLQEGRDTNTECYSSEAGWKVSDLCNHKPYCEVKASDPMFTDPCPDTHKLLNIVYQCASCQNQEGYDEKCEDYAMRGECEMNPMWMLASCRKACWRCEANLACHDKADFYDCTQWGARGECQHNQKWMNRNCQYTCNKCMEKVEDDWEEQEVKKDVKDEGLILKDEPEEQRLSTHEQQEEVLHQDNKQDQPIFQQKTEQKVDTRERNFSDKGEESDGPGLKKYYSVIAILATVGIMGSMIVYLSRKPNSKKAFKKSA